MLTAIGRGSPSPDTVLVGALGGIFAYAILTSVFGDGLVEFPRHAHLGNVSLYVLALLAAVPLIMKAGSRLFTPARTAPATALTRTSWSGWVLLAAVVAVPLTSPLWLSAWKRQPLAIGVVDQPASNTLASSTLTLHGWAMDPFGPVHAVAIIDNSTRVEAHAWKHPTDPSGAALARTFPTYRDPAQARFEVRDRYGSIWQSAARCPNVCAEPRRNHDRNRPQSIHPGRAMKGRAVIVAPFLICVALYASVISGHFLSDDMSVIYVLAGWQDHGELWSRLFSKFSSGLDTPSHYYRPLAFLSFGLNLAIDGPNPVPWHLVNLAGHLAAGAAVYRISSALQPGATSRFGPCLAAALFLLCGTNAEAVAWISGRYDIFATAFSLWAAALYLRSRASFDRHELAALTCGVLALASKESGAILPGLIGCLAWIKHGQTPSKARWKSIVRDLAPWLLLIAGYFALRQAIFGSMLQVYPGTQPLERIANGGWSRALTSMLPWLSAALPDKALLALAGILSALMVAAGLITGVLDRSVRRAEIGVLAAIVWSLALLLPHLGGLLDYGEGGRNFYAASALVALWLGVPFGARRIAGSPGVTMRLYYVLGLALLGVQAALLHAALRDWRIAGAQMSQLVSALPGIKASLPVDGYAFVFVPDHIGAAPFARSAQGAMILPPIQRQPLLSGMMVFVPAKLPEIPALLKQQLIPTMKRYPLEEAIEKLNSTPAVDSASGIVWPTAVFCWRQDVGSLQRLELRPAWDDTNQWERDIRGCDEPGGLRQPASVLIGASQAPCELCRHCEVCAPGASRRPLSCPPGADQTRGHSPSPRHPRQAIQRIWTRNPAWKMT